MMTAEMSGPCISGNSSRLQKRAATILLITFSTLVGVCEHWPEWSGVGGSGNCRERKLPVHFYPYGQALWALAQ